MKKLIISSVLGVALAASTAFGQGFINFGGAVRSVWNDTGTSVSSTATTPDTDSGFEATFLWSATSSASPLGAGIATNNTTTYSYTALWNSISNSAVGGTWQFALDLSNNDQNVVGTPANNLGSFSYEGGAATALVGSTGPGETINMITVGWETMGGLYTTLASAEAAGAPVGYSSVYSTVLGNGPPSTPPSQTVITKFGIGPAPEPTTLALAGLGGLSMLFLRRKKA